MYACNLSLVLICITMELHNAINSALAQYSKLVGTMHPCINAIIHTSIRMLAYVHTRLYLDMGLWAWYSHNLIPFPKT